ncbi:RNA pseudouridylate synthase domain-containing protein 1 isoform X1 [Scleropages formosus]|uniref:RNA pseudouridine synthase domain containing 1 n=1 Tax=Scleropages formosus TaxID=113540 RepID=A0A8C9RMT5_SCLFO|nr:RNA pseudouridylate synthase domain-containing protein 1 isoform X1 [Scleropages formosus]XP_018612584.2 RNA pseudouridylate synthase domain-containing protein 1 isoform X1 [Scleropages formosus]
MEPASLENLHVLYQSTHFIVVNKHWDIRIDSKMWYEKQTVQSQLRHRFPELADPGTYYGFRFCHQLDFSTSGALCVALNKAAAGRAYRCFKDRLVTKAYLALLRGSVEKLKTTLDFAIGKNTSQGKTHMMCIEGTEGCENPKPCQTELTVLEYGLYDGDPVTKVLLQPLTGRTHQLRVHCSAIGHPIVGDFTYSLRTDGAPYRMMLHAYLLRIPLEDEPICVTAPDPFLPSVDPKWVSQCLLQPLEGALDGLLGCGLAPGSQGLESQSTGEEEETNSKVSMETEEQRAQCQQWLCEWALH